MNEGVEGTGKVGKLTTCSFRTEASASRLTKGPHVGNLGVIVDSKLN